MIISQLLGITTTDTVEGRAAVLTALAEAMEMMAATEVTTIIEEAAVVVAVAAVTDDEETTETAISAQTVDTTLIQSSAPSNMSGTIDLSTISPVEITRGNEDEELA